MSPNRVPTDTGKWGGIIILGDAMVGQDEEMTISKGLPLDMTGPTTEEATQRFFRGIDLCFYSSQWYAIGWWRRNSRTSLGGVGAGTTINNIEVVGSNDDGIEIFGL